MAAIRNLSCRVLPPCAGYRAVSSGDHDVLHGVQPAEDGTQREVGVGGGGVGKRISVHGAVYGELFEHPRGKNNHISLPVPIQHSLSFIWTVHPSTASPLRRVWPENLGSDTDPGQLRGKG